jgi:hypothetical protein
LYLSEIDSPPAPLRSLKSQSSQSEFFFSLSAERAESEKQQPFGQNRHHLLSTNILLDSALLYRVYGGLMLYVYRPLNGKHKLYFLCALCVSAVKNTIRQ